MYYWDFWIIDISSTSDIAYGDVIQGAKIIQNQEEVDLDSEKQEDTYKENQPFSTAIEGNPHAYAYSIFQVRVYNILLLFSLLHIMCCVSFVLFLFFTYRYL